MNTDERNIWACTLHIWPEDETGIIDAEDMEAFIAEMVAYAEARGWLIMGAFNYENENAEAPESYPGVPMQ
jgi:hypothetical protein